MPHLLHIDSSIQADASVSRALTARAAARWHTVNPGGTIVYRDLAADPIPHLSANVFQTPAERRTPAEARSYALGVELAGEIKHADAVVLGLPLYNFGPPSTVKAWVDHLIIPGVTIDPATMQGLLDTPLHVIAVRGGGYGEGTPRAGWDHAASWLPHGLSLTGLVPQLIVCELTLASVNPAMADLIPLAQQSRADAEARIDELFSVATA